MCSVIFRCKTIELDAKFSCPVKIIALYSIRPMLNNCILCDLRTSSHSDKKRDRVSTLPLRKTG